ncbi:hypothetical protein ACPCA8_32220 [Streptomyces capoamus]|uniref:hypothetical protein n=1 Tax=Streptomyces capoamus TaxID=68183 RepID=UPI003C2BE151
MAIQDQLEAFISRIQLTGGGSVTSGSLINVGLTPDPLRTGLVTDETGVTRTTALVKMLRFSDSTLPDQETPVGEFLTGEQILGGQAMPAIAVQLPGPPLTGFKLQHGSNIIGYSRAGVPRIALVLRVVDGRVPLLSRQGMLAAYDALARASHEMDWHIGESHNSARVNELTSKAKQAVGKSRTGPAFARTS